ncbi:hypothetical protein ElyMa_005961700 [Elysia marginata]|uniref:Secreted protein n=1 Tax=Elysia marginata TaxID=1093978 RepID=A0AAV4GBR3_9GAST|nr:hypothetical protein ElyMa_005961700 [Elysia marginata]
MVIVAIEAVVVVVFVVVIVKVATVLVIVVVVVEVEAVTIEEVVVEVAVAVVYQIRGNIRDGAVDNSKGAAIRDVRSACVYHTQSHYPDTGPTRLNTESIMPDTRRITC